MTMTIEQLKALAEDARPISDADYGTARQIDAENKFFHEISEAFPHLFDDDFYSHTLDAKMTTNEIINHALEVLAARPTIMSELISLYAVFNAEQGLNLGSADEHFADERLTAAQRAWLVAYSTLWDASVALEEKSA